MDGGTFCVLKHGCSCPFLCFLLGRFYSVLNVKGRHFSYTDKSTCIYYSENDFELYVLSCFLLAENYTYATAGSVKVLVLHFEDCPACHVTIVYVGSGNFLVTCTKTNKAQFLQGCLVYVDTLLSLACSWTLKYFSPPFATCTMMQLLGVV